MNGQRLKRIAVILGFVIVFLLAVLAVGLVLRARRGA